jgi:hypothetical protein
VNIDDKNLRSEIHHKLTSKAANTWDFEGERAKHYEIFFNIYPELLREYREISKVSKIEKIKFITRKGMLKELEMIVDGDALQLQIKVTEEANKKYEQNREIEDAIWEKEEIERRRKDYADKVKNGTNTAFDDDEIYLLDHPEESRFSLMLKRGKVVR